MSAVIAPLAFGLALVSGIGAALVAMRSARRRGMDGRARTAARISISDVIRGAIFGLAFTFVCIVTLVFVANADAFGMIHVVYDQLVVALPLAAAIVTVTVIWRRRRTDGQVGLTRPAAVLAGLCVLAAPLGFYTSFVAPYQLQTETVEAGPLPAARAGDAPIRFAVMTDFQARRIGTYEREVFDRLVALEADVILLPGDVFQDSQSVFERELPALREQLSRLHAPGGVFLVGGDVDDKANLRRMTEGTAVRYLDGEVVHTMVRDRALTIGGIELDYESERSRATVRELETTRGADDVRVLLAHRPDAVFDVPERSPRTDLVVTGHTHGGQVALPFFGPLMTLSNVPRQVAAGGLHRMGDRQIYVGHGVGMERGQAPPMRLLVPPNIGLITLR